MVGPVSKIHLCGLILLLVGCGKQQPTLFEKVESSQSAIHFTNTLTPTDSLNAFTFTNYYNGGGVGIGDFDNDSLPDLFFAGNQVSCQLYRNEGNFEFKDITQTASVTTNRWCTGVSVVDINQDGWDDVYVSVARHPTFPDSRNLLFVNQRTPEPTFKEEAERYGLAYEGFTTQTAFLDYDLDGDLDAFLLNTAPDTQNPNNLRPAINDGTYPSTDRLFRNEGKDERGQITFADVSQQAGIRYEGLGLGVVVSDLNDDGYPDIYCSNDFISSDILYLNNQDGTFKNVIQTATAHTSLYGMGVDAADLTNDLKVDLLQMDMLPEDNFRQKQMLAGQDYDRKEMSISPRYNYQLQYMRNTLQVNVGTNPQTHAPEFSEMGLLAGLARTDWSWATLLADYDNDGRKDVFITNGYRKNITDRDFITYAEEYSFFGTDQSRQKKRGELLNNVPEIKLRNYAFRNVADYQFENVSAAWGMDESSYSNGAVWADLDRDGDLDLIVNNIDDKASVFKNTSDQQSNYLIIKPVGSATNRAGLGVVATVWAQGHPQRVENQVVRGYASSVEPGLHFGLGKAQKVDSILIQWPGGRVERLYDLAANETLYPDYSNAKSELRLLDKKQPLFAPLTLTGLAYPHQESDFVDFKQTATLHKMLSRSGFALVVGDANGDQFDDVFVGGAYRGSPSQLFIQQKDGSFQPSELPDAPGNEVADAVFFDADRDGDQDLLVVYGGNERPLSVRKAYQPRLYLNDRNGHFTLAETSVLPDIPVSASSVIAFDYDQDGDQDLFVAGRQVPGRYPLPAQSYLLRNESRPGSVRFTDVTRQAGTSLGAPGMVCDVVSTNLNQDAYPDLVLVGEWMPVRMFLNQGGKQFTPYAVDQFVGTEGWWNCVAAGDLDRDGDTDFIVGNEGLNTFYGASAQKPVRIVGKDFNGDGTFDPIMGYYMGEKLYPAPPRDALNQQVIQFRKKFQNYGLYAKATFEDLFEKDELKNAWQAEAKLLQTVVLLNEGSGKFTQNPLPRLAQQAPVFGIVPYDYNQDGHLDLVLTGNFFPNEVHMGRQDASTGLLLLGNGTGSFSPGTLSGLHIRGDARTSRLIRTPTGLTLLTALNGQGIVAHKVAPPGKVGLEL